MNGKPRTVAASEFEARCLSLLDEVAATGREIVVTRMGRPVARVVPVAGAARQSLLGSVTFMGDLVAPFHEDWSV